MLKEGRAEALEQGVSKPTGIDCVQFGLLRAARMNPLRISPNEVTTWIRRALYGWTEGEHIDPTTADQVIGRLLEAIEPHLSDNTEEFYQWFLGPNNTLDSQIAKKGRAPGGALDRDIVNQVFFWQGWLAYQYVADCVHTALDTFRTLLPVPLNPVENRVFGRMHLKQDCFGGLPSYMLAQRFPQLRLIRTDVYEKEDNTESVAIMHRLLQYYALMAVARREADRLIKRSKKKTGDKKFAKVNNQLRNDELADNRRAGADSVEVSSETDTIADQLRLSLGISCKCQEPDWGLEVWEGFEKGMKEAPLTLFCRGYNFKHNLPVSIARLRELKKPNRE